MNVLPKPYAYFVGTTIYHNDCRDILPLLSDELVDLIVTDPPYGGILREEWDRNDTAFSVAVIRDLYRILKSTGSLYTWCGIGEKSRSLPVFLQRLDTVFHFKDLITWKKRRGIGMRRGWLYTREEILWYVKDNSQFFWSKEHQYSEEENQFLLGMSGTLVHPYKRHTNVWTDIPEPLVRKDNTHPAEKPVEAIQRIILAHTVTDNLILDPYAGSGSTLVAAARNGRRSIGIEIEARYCEAAAIRVEREIAATKGATT